MFNIYWKLCLALKKVRMSKITPPQIPSTQQQNSPQQNFRYSFQLGEGEISPSNWGTGRFPPPLKDILKTLVSRHLSVKPCSSGWFTNTKVHHRTLILARILKKVLRMHFWKQQICVLEKKIISEILVDCFI